MNAKYYRTPKCYKVMVSFLTGVYCICILLDRYRPSELYNIVSDVTSYPSFVPFCTGARIMSKSTPTTPRLGGLTSPQALARVMEAELTVGFLSFRESYVSKVTCRPNELVEVSYHPLRNIQTRTNSMMSHPLSLPLCLIGCSVLFNTAF